MGEAYLSVLRRLKPKLKWEQQHAEHRIKYKVSGRSHQVSSGRGCYATVQELTQCGIAQSACMLTLPMEEFVPSVTLTPGCQAAKSAVTARVSALVRQAAEQAGFGSWSVQL
jgi:hypothetical protein